ncbi:Hypothetical_protein [Hexamita inflata]|uniref:Hypothetical_protein n=1 Tax=Hexamita inflata TaxID=28002 RepID=A0AA86RLF8_9EUKA|nr:Hypothetical protein HINF_LOCUS64633 [Hexamita inflata]
MVEVVFENFVNYLRSGNTDKLNIISFQQNQQHKINLSTQLIFYRILTKTVVQLSQNLSCQLANYGSIFHKVANAILRQKGPVRDKEDSYNSSRLLRLYKRQNVTHHHHQQHQSISAFEAVIISVLFQLQFLQQQD